MPLVRPALPGFFALAAAQPDTPFCNTPYTRGPFAVRPTFRYVDVGNFGYRLE